MILWRFGPKRLSPSLVVWQVRHALLNVCCPDSVSAPLPAGSWGTAGKTRNTKKVVPRCASQQKLCAKSAKPYRGNDFSEQFRKWSDDAGLPHCSAHGLRKAGCRRMAEAGYTAHEIAAWSGHATLDEVSRYTKAVDQERLARIAMEREQSGTQVSNPIERECQSL